MGLSVVILSAGKGTRMKSELPKVLHKICGFEMLYYSIKEAKKISDDISVVLYHKANLVEERIKRYFSDIKIEIQDLENYPGTGGAVMGLDFIHDRVLVLNGDMPLIEAEELKKFTNFNSDIVMSLIDLKDPTGYGRVVIKNSEVDRIIEEKDATEDEKLINYVNGGVYLFKKSILNFYLPKLDNNNIQKEYYLTDIIELAKRDGHSIKPLFVKEENFKGVNSKVDLANAEIIMQKRIREKFMKKGVIMKLPETIYIEEGVEIEGESIIENGVSLLNGTKIINSHIKTNSIIEDSIIENSSIGPLARVRPKSEISDSHIGNFVEVKKSILKGVKAGHLSYLGDSEIDKGTNIGAGVITCNYDGKAKYKTIIGKNVFVGSDTQIVAPVKIEDEVIIGAGTTITDNIPKGSLGISRTPLKIVKNFYKKFFKK